MKALLKKLAYAFCFSLVALVPASLAGQQAPPDPHAQHAATPASAPGFSTASDDPKLPAAEENAKARLEKSSRHGEYADIKLDGSATPIRAWVVYPERKDKAPVVIVIHEIFGLSDWIRAVADQLAAEGFIAVAPDLLSGKGPAGGGTDSVSSRDDVVKLIRSLTPEEVIVRLNAVRDYALALPAGNKRTATIGFCWGGSASFNYASKQPALDAAVVYYGTSPDAAALATLKAPVLGLYGADDARVVSTIEPAKAEMQKLGKSYEPNIYEGAGHGFLRDQHGRDGANHRATEQAWPRTLKFLRDNTN
jgi:carboxymethylenebutenolidase